MAAEKDRRDFFISFNSADREWAAWTSKELEDAGKSVYFQHWDIRPGSNFVLEMDKAARMAERTIVVLSANYLGARPSSTSIRRAVTRSRRANGCGTV